MKTFCCCIQLRTGGILIGILQVIGAILGILVTAILAYSILSIYRNGQISHHLSVDGETKDKIQKNVTEAVVDKTSEAELEKGFKVKMVIAFIAILSAYIIQLLVCSFLLHGIRKRKPSFLTGWIIYNCLCFTISVVAYFFHIIFAGFTPTNVAGIFSLFINVYFIGVISSLQRKIKEEVDEESRNSHAASSAKV